MAVSRCSVQGKEKGLDSPLRPVDVNYKESVMHGTASLPVAIYRDDIAAEEVMWHWHEELEVGYIIEGEVVVKAGNAKYTLKEGDGFFVNAGVMHAAENACCGKPAKLKSLVFHASIVGGEKDSIFDTSLIAPLVRNHSLPAYIYKGNEEKDASMIREMEKAWNAICMEEDDYLLVMRNALSGICYSLVHSSGEQRIPDKTDVIHEQRAQTMLDYIHRNYGEKRTFVPMCG